MFSSISIWTIEILHGSDGSKGLMTNENLISSNIPDVIPTIPTIRPSSTYVGCSVSNTSYGWLRQLSNQTQAAASSSFSSFSGREASKPSTKNNQPLGKGHLWLRKLVHVCRYNMMLMKTSDVYCWWRQVDVCCWWRQDVVDFDMLRICFLEAIVLMK